jgi:membrane associated rhomboid family serine protease
MLIFTGTLVAINVLTVVSGLSVGGETGQVAWQAHLGGFVAGLLLSGPFDSLRPRSVGAPLDH